MDGVQIIYRDEQLVAIDKAPGVLVHRTRMDPEETRVALQMTRDAVGQYVYPIHRLDKPTSGVLLFGLDKKIAGAMRHLFDRHEVQKRYLALLRGYADEEGEVDYAIQVEGRGRQEARTLYRRLHSIELPIAVNRYPTSRYCLVEAWPQTGRRHQIRRHFAHLRHPIVGDNKHGDYRHNRMFKERYGLEHLLLSAVSLHFTHPVSKKEILIECPPSAKMEELIALFWGLKRKRSDPEIAPPQSEN